MAWHCCMLFFSASLSSALMSRQSISFSRRFISSSRVTMASSLPHFDYTMEGLQIHAEDLVKRNEKTVDDLRTSICISVAGAGGHAISSLTATSGASKFFLNGDVTYSRKAYLKHVGMPSNTAGFFYSSREAAKMASEAALKKALIFRTDNIRRMPGCIGIGSASSLSDGAEISKAYIVATRADGVQLTLDINMDDAGKSRLDEDIVLSHLILRSIDLVKKDGIQDLSTLEDKGISISAEWNQGVDKTASVTNRILEDNEEAVVLIPVYNEMGSPKSFLPLEPSVLPNGCLIFPGSFNPPHTGHTSLAKAALRTENERKRSSRTDHKAVFMELSIWNADKGSIPSEAVEERLSKFLTLDDLPRHWGVLLTRAPLFSQKVAILQSRIDTFDASSPNFAFVIGTDTLVRIIDKKYYNNNESDMVEALCSMKGVNFLVGGRLEQKNGAKRARFLSGSEEIKDLPEKLKKMFTIIAEEDFRVDLSSSEIRKELEGKDDATF